MVHSERHTVYAATATTTMGIQIPVPNALEMSMKLVLRWTMNECP
jgi:hypothetical protein